MAPIGYIQLLKIIKEVSYFENIYFNHIYREINKHADKLSKEVLLLQQGSLVKVESRRQTPPSKGSVVPRKQFRNSKAYILKLPF